MTDCLQLHILYILSVKSEGVKQAKESKSFSRTDEELQQRRKDKHRQMDDHLYKQKKNKEDESPTKN